MSLLAESVAKDAWRAGLLDVLLETRLVVGVSGGADSLALLSVLRELRGTHAVDMLHIAHLDHGFRGDQSAADARFVEELAREWGLACTVAYFDVPAYAASRKLSAENAARRVRYAFLAGVAQEHDSVVAVAHNADDQAETVLMHLLRGSGVTGLAGMRVLSDIPVDTSDPELRLLLREDAPSKVRVFRPLLGIWRVDIEAYCREAGLVPRLDASNLDPTYRRNFIRHEVLPALETASPQVKRHLARLANIAAAEDDLLQQITAQEWDRLGIEVKEGPSISVSVEAIAALPLGIARRIVRRMLQTVAGHTDGTDFQQIEAALQVLSGAPDSPVAVDLPQGLRVKRHGVLGIVERQDGDGGMRPHDSGINRPIMSAEASMRLDYNATLTLTDDWQVAVRLLGPGEVLPTPGDYIAIFDHDVLPAHEHLALRTRLQGDVIQPLGLRGHKKLQDVLVDAKIPREMRAYLPIVALAGRGGEVLWVPGPGGRRSAIAPITEQTQRYLCIEFLPAPEKNQEGEGSA